MELRKIPTTGYARALLAGWCAVVLLAGAPARAQSEASVALSVLPVASVAGSVGMAGAAASAAVALPVALAASGAVLTVRAVQASAQGTVIVLERLSDGAVASVEVASELAGGLALSVGAVVMTTVIASGVILSAAGEALVFIPNAIGRALLHSERVDRNRGAY